MGMGLGALTGVQNQKSTLVNANEG
jgi:hypothetical protein